MGMYIFPKAVNHSLVAKTFGSNDEQLLEKVKKAESYENYSEGWDDEYISLDQALTDIIFAKPYTASSAHMYGYAYICICEALGVDVPSYHELKLGYETDLVTQYLAEDFGIENMEVEEYLFEQDATPELPVRDDFPMLGVIMHKDLQALIDKLPDITLSDDELEELFDEDDDKGCAYEHLKALKQNLQFCLENNLDLVSVCH